jgi:hypothetical protein
MEVNVGTAWGDDGDDENVPYRIISDYFQLDDDDCYPSLDVKKCNEAYLFINRPEKYNHIFRFIETDNFRKSMKIHPETEDIDLNLFMSAYEQHLRKSYVQGYFELRVKNHSKLFYCGLANCYNNRFANGHRIIVSYILNIDNMKLYALYLHYYMHKIGDKPDNATLDALDSMLSDREFIEKIKKNIKGEYVYVTHNV